MIRNDGVGGSNPSCGTRSLTRLQENQLFTEPLFLEPTFRPTPGGGNPISGARASATSICRLRMRSRPVAVGLADGPRKLLDLVNVRLPVAVIARFPDGAPVAARGHGLSPVKPFDGKGMIVCMRRRICVSVYDAIIKLRPALHSEDDEVGAIKVVMAGAASDPSCRRMLAGALSKAVLALRAGNRIHPV